MKKIIYIANWDQSERSGVSKKILGQIQAMRKLGANVEYIATEKNKIYLSDNNTSTCIGKCSSNKVLKQMKIISENIKLVKRTNDIELIYIRYLFTTPQLIKLLKVAKKKNIKIVEEFPTYPYDEEIENGNRLDLKLALAVDKHYRNKLKNYIDKVTTFTNDDEIFNIETIKIENGINVNDVKPIDIKVNSKQINMIAVSVLEYWQGYDRIIKSLKNYYKNKKDIDPEIVIHIVGDGREFDKLKKLTQELQLENNVIFYGFLSGKELDNVYEKCQCAIAGLGIFRKRIKFAKTLKIREYTARAIPFIYSTIDESLVNFKYAYKVSDDEEMIDIKEIINFLNGLDINLVKKEMRNFAEENYKWETQMKKMLKGAGFENE